MYGRGRLFTVISILRVVVCYGRIVRSRGGRVAHLVATDEKALGTTINFVCPSVWPR